MNYGCIKYCDVANGSGVRTVLFVSGCRNRCKGCFQPETWDFNYGRPFTKVEEDLIIESLKPDYIAGLTLLGGDPMEPENQAGIVPFLRRVTVLQKSVWCYTGYVLERDLCPGGQVYTPYTDEFLSLIDVLVDGPFIEEQKSLMLPFRGSENQRIIDMHEFPHQIKLLL